MNEKFKYKIVFIAEDYLNLFWIKNGRTNALHQKYFLFDAQVNRFEKNYAVFYKCTPRRFEDFESAGSFWTVFPGSVHSVVVFFSFSWKSVCAADVSPFARPKLPVFSQTAPSEKNFLSCAQFLRIVFHVFLFFTWNLFDLLNTPTISQQTEVTSTSVSHTWKYIWCIIFYMEKRKTQFPVIKFKNYEPTRTLRISTS